MNMDSEQKQILKEFQQLVINCKRDRQIFQVTSFLDQQELDSDFQETLILEKLYFGVFSPLKNNKTDAIQYALANKCPRLFIALMHRIPKQRAAYVANNSFLQQSIDATSEEEKQLEAVLAVYDAHKLPVDIEGLPERTKQKLYDSSWSIEIVKRLYNKSNTFFIPREQKKAKMYALIYYNTFDTYHQTRVNAKEESECMMVALREEGFTVFEPIIDWTNEELLLDLRQKIQGIKEECSVLFVCIMSHGDKGVVYDKNSIKGEINEVLREVHDLPYHIPAAVMIQSCQGSQQPQQQVDVLFREIDGNNKDATVVPGSGTGPHDSQISLSRPNTIVVTATASSCYASRHIFFSHLAEEIRFADGETPFASMVIACSSKMSQNDDEILRAQAPMQYSLLRLLLVLPRSIQRDKTRLQTRAQIFYTKEGRENGAMDEADMLHSSLSKVAAQVQKVEWSNAEDLQDSVQRSTGGLTPDCSLLFIGVMSHGRMGALVGADGIMLPVNDLINQIRQNIPESLPLVLMIQACQTVTQFLSADDSTQLATLTDPLDANRGSSDGCMHIVIEHPYTVLLMATAAGGSAQRGAYTKALSLEIGKADGKKNIHEMHTDAVKAMRGEMGVYADDIRQIPEYRDTLNGEYLVLPKSKQLPDKAKSQPITSFFQ